MTSKIDALTLRKLPEGGYLLTTVARDGYYTDAIFASSKIGDAFEYIRATFCDWDDE